MRATADLKIFTTCPVSTLDKARACLRRIENVARWSEAAGCEGILVFSDNRQLDPWLVSRAIMGATEKLCPLVAVQPAYAHPYTIAKTIASFGFMYGRRVYLNMVAGGFANDMQVLNDATPHDQRYARLVEYTKIIQRLLRSDEPVTFDGFFCKVTNLRMVPPLPPELQPPVFVSGSSDAGRSAALELGATAIEYPTPATAAGQQPDRTPSKRGYGVRIGIITDRDEARAWSIASERFPEDRKGQLTRQLATKVSDSRWHQQLSELADDEGRNGNYWLAPFRNYQAMCPYLVGSYDQVAAELARYVDDGCETFIVDEPASEEDMQHTGFVFELVTEHCAAA
jgi:alkanesulfonate monooxygenase